LDAILQIVPSVDRNQQLGVSPLIFPPYYLMLFGGRFNIFEGLEQHVRAQNHARYFAEIHAQVLRGTKRVVLNAFQEFPKFFVGRCILDLIEIFPGNLEDRYAEVFVCGYRGYLKQYVFEVLNLLSSDSSVFVVCECLGIFLARGSVVAV